jgi:spermidine synthase
MKNFKTNFEKMVSINGNLLSHEDAKNEIMITQMINLQYGNVKELVNGRIVDINLESVPSEKNAELSRFKLVLVDSIHKETLDKNNCAILIVPQGKESFPVYSTENGYRRLSESVGHSRLIVVHLKSGHSFESFDSVKKELESTIVRFAQHGYTNEIPYVSEGKDIGKRSMVGIKYKVIKPEEDKFDPDEIDQYEYQDQYVIEDLLEESESGENVLLRAIKFKTKLGEVQSDIRIRKKKVRDRKKDFSDLVKVRSPLWKTESDEFLYIDHNFLNSEYLCAMITGLCAYYNLFEDDTNKEKKSNFLVLGTGAGMLPMFLYKALHPIIARLNTVDLDETIVKIGQDYLGFNTDLGKNFRSEIGDALQFLEKDALKGKTNTVFIDIASEDQGATQIPPENFLDESFFKLLFDALSPNHHVVLFNTCCYSDAERDSTYAKINEKFKYCAYIDCSESSNRVYILSNTHAPNLAKTSENTIKYFVKTFCDGKNADGHNWATSMNMKELLEGMVYGSGKKTEVKIEQVESGLKKKKKQKK